MIKYDKLSLVKRVGLAIAAGTLAAVTMGCSVNEPIAIIGNEDYGRSELKSGKGKDERPSLRTYMTEYDPNSHMPGGDIDLGVGYRWKR